MFGVCGGDLYVIEFVCVVDGRGGGVGIGMCGYW